MARKVGPRHPCGFYDAPKPTTDEVEERVIPRREWSKTPTEETRMLGDEGAAAVSTWYEAEAAQQAEKLLELDEEFKLLTDDPIEKPAHYTAGKVECIDAIESAAEGWPGWIAPHLANAMKYEWRAFKKGKALRDLRKARWYLDRAMEALLAHGYTETE